MAIANQPVQVHERINLLDVLRGLALFGILVVNMRDFNFPTECCEPGQLWSAPIDQIVEAVIAFFFSEKFYSLFSLLFGIGFGLQMERLTVKHRHAELFYGRRLFILLFMGLAHGIFIWWGDVLAIYAIFGFFLLCFRPLPVRWILFASIACLVIPVVFSTVKITSERLRQETNVQEQGEKLFTSKKDQKALNNSRNMIELYTHGSYFQIMEHRLRQLKSNYFAWLFRNYGFQVFGMFLLGLYLVKQKIIQEWLLYLPIIRKVWQYSLGLSILAFILFCIKKGMSGSEFTIFDLVSYEFQKLERTILCLLYVSSIALLTQQAKWKNILNNFAPVGRMALTNYLLQSVIWTSIFYSYGFGLYGTISPVFGLFLTCVFFTGQVIMSKLWMNKFRFGPFEWVWRSLTYGTFQPMRLTVQ